MGFLFSLLFGRFAVAGLLSFGLLFAGPCQPQRSIKKTVVLEIENSELKETNKEWEHRARYAESYIEEYCVREEVAE